MSVLVAIKTVINGATVSARLEPRILLSDFLRDALQLSATKVGCEHGVCGACSILYDGELTRSCLTFAVQAHQHEVTTLEGIRDLDAVRELVAKMEASHAVQCGFCTPGIVVASYAYLRDGGAPDPETFREYISGNLCRCTGYQGIVDAVCSGPSSTDREGFTS